jgi:hypothetical protein
MAEFVGDGHTTTVLGREGRAAEDIAGLRPHKVLASETWLAEVCAGRGPRWPVGLDRRRARRRVREGLGGRLRWIETSSPLATGTVRALAAADVALEFRDGVPGESGFVN